MRERQQWIHDYIGALLSCGPSFPPAAYRCHIAETLTAYEKVLTGGSGHAFAKYLSIDPTTLQRYKRGELVPQLSMVVHLCRRLRISPTELLNGTSMEVLSEQCLHTPGIPALSKPKSSLKKFDHQKVLPALEAALQSTIEPPPSMREVARQVGYDVGHIMHYYRSHCHKIAQRYLAYRSMKHEQRLESMKEEVRKVMLALHAQGHYPSSMRVRQFLSYPHAFKDPQVYAVWKSIMQELGLRN
jgi:transcriptional regulator with XRE-family HTH domain